MSFRAYVDFDDGSEEMMDEVFDTEEEAIENAQQWASDYSQGGDYLKEAGEEHSEQQVIGFHAFEE